MEKMKRKVISLKNQTGSTDPLLLLKKQRKALQKAMADLVMKCYQPSIIDVSGQAIYHKWSSEKAENAFKKAQALFIVISRKIKEQDELS